jgi:hypothetical protein
MDRILFLIRYLKEPTFGGTNPKVPFGFTQNQEQECSVKKGGKLNAEPWMT